jgi:hypothetical protein
MENYELNVACSNGEVTISQGDNILRMETSTFVDIINESQKDMVYMDSQSGKLKEVGKKFI